MYSQLIHTKPFVFITSFYPSLIVLIILYVFYVFGTQNHPVIMENEDDVSDSKTRSNRSSMSNVVESSFNPLLSDENLDKLKQNS